MTAFMYKKNFLGLLFTLSIVIFVGNSPAFAEKIDNPIVEFTGLDKITGRTVNFDVYIDETVQFGTLLVTPRVCHSRTPDEPQQISSFLEVDEVTLKREIRRIFTGWMFASSPGLNAIEHPVYDVWVINCKTESSVPKPESTN